MKKTNILLVTSFILIAAISGLWQCNQSTSNSKTSESKSEVIHLTSAEFQQKVFDYTKQEYKFLGTEPCIVDFYADWCKPCKMIAPIMDELSNQYKGRIKIYKINIDNEPELANTLSVQSIPALLFCPQNEQPQMLVGAMSKEEYVKTINDVLKVK